MVLVSWPSCYREHLVAVVAGAPRLTHRRSPLSRFSLDCPFVFIIKASYESIQTCQHLSSPVDILAPSRRSRAPGMSQDPSAPPGYTPSQPEVLVSPLADRLSYLNHDAVEGQVYVKGIAETGKGDQALSAM